MSEWISAIYPYALDSGMTAGGFWNNSPAEICDAIESHQRKKKQEVMLLFVQAEAMAERISRLFGNKEEALMPWDYFPEAFAEEKAAKDKEKMEDFKTRRRNAMDAYNAMRNREGV